MPAGILTSILFLRLTLPLPLHFWHGVSTILPLPPQAEQVRCVLITPNAVLL